MGERTARDEARPDMPTVLAEEMLETGVWPKSAGFDNSEVTAREKWLLRSLVKARKHLAALQAEVDSIR